MALDIAPPRRDMPRASARRREQDAIWRLCAWGGSAAFALGALVLTVQSDFAATRIDALVGNAPPPTPAQVAQRPPEKDPEIARLQAEVRSLSADRDRLAARFAALERNLEEVTGSIQSRAPSASSPSAPPQPAAASTTPASVASKPAVTIIDPLAMPAVTGSIGGWPQEIATAKSEVADKQDAADEPPQAATLATREVPRAPNALAALPAREPVASPRTASRVEYGIDLGGARDMDALRQRWAGIKANLGPLLTGLQPVAVRDHKPGSAELRLVVGPMPNLAAAKQVCTRFTAAHVACQATKFDGEAIVQR